MPHTPLGSTVNAGPDGIRTSPSVSIPFTMVPALPAGAAPSSLPHAARTSAPTRRTAPVVDLLERRVVAATARIAHPQSPAP
jgi:hypothetical protein